MSKFHEIMRAGSTVSRISRTLGFTGQHTNPVRAERRKQIRQFGGIRQFRKAVGLGLVFSK